MTLALQSGNGYRWSTAWLPVLRRMARTRPVVLGYHGVNITRSRDDLFLLQLHPQRFRAGLELMLEAGFRFTTVTQMLELAGGAMPAPGLAAVSFDDALRNNLDVALPILQALGILASVYVPTAWLGGRSPWITSARGAEIMTSAEVAEVHHAGWEVGSHTVSHADLAGLDYSACRHEIGGSIEALEAITGTRPRTLAYPYGRYGPNAIAAARDCGLVGAVTTGSGSWAPFELTRAMIGAADPFPLILLKMVDRYERVLQVPGLRAVRAGSKRLRGRLSGSQPTGGLGRR